MITPELKDKCLKILDELVSHPISTVFQEPVDPIIDEVPDYFDVIKEPSDLSTVRERLLSDKYTNLQEFKREVNLIWENAVAYNGKSSYPAYIADQLSKIFSRQFSLLEDQNYEHWINEFLKARSILFKLFHNPPKSIESTTSSKSKSGESLMNSSSFQFSDSIIEVPIDYDQKILQEDLQFLNENNEIFQNPRIHLKLVQILAQNEPPINVPKSSAKLNLSNISIKTMKMLKKLIIESKEDKDQNNADNSKH
ncbi:hypothetical protein M9Y10_028697 [Tritrichomonas musculus]|uniref:Bromo domain-containing protein n=1 Tax=Tritrichomonas musculus TaxID=1915356 RepID=A0ABR2KK27_9EUKA